jgi:hypothetical protein
MSALHPAGRTLQTRFWIALLAAFAVVSGCASGNAADEPEKPGAPSIGQATDALVANSEKVYACLDGAAPASLLVDPDVAGAAGCSISPGRLGSSSYEYCTENPGCVKICPDCRNLANGFGCQFVGDIDALRASSAEKYACVDGAVPGSLLVRLGTAGAPPACGISKERLAGSSDMYCFWNPGCVETCPDCRALASGTFKCVF